LLVAACLLAVVLTHPCAKSVAAASWGLVMFALTGCLLEAHMRTVWAGPEDLNRAWFRTITRALRNVLSVAWWVFLMSIPIAAILPAYSCYGDRAKVTQALALVTGVRQDITDRAANTLRLSDVGQGLQVPANDLFTLATVGNDGTIMLFMQDPGAALVLQPQWQDAAAGTVRWVCRGAPLKAMPAECRTP
jgi:Tfp pilus assembly major pilin PilA